MKTAKTVALKKVKEIVAKYNGEKSSLIAILQDVQEAYRYLPQEALIYISKELHVPLTKVYEVATFYKAFSLTPQGEHIVKLCMGTACHVRGAANILDQLERTLHLKPGQTSSDYQFTLETVNCVGACALGPVMVTDGEYHGQVNLKKADKVIASLQKGARS
ncbi:MAG: NAD(P)H-dependent oxidoreductase subunit E [Deltaproteobacteria bacterium]|nr:NAD(P)H-dependent oxidoreductase subunit E [Deltaproteobacteria bacterium]